MHWVRRLIVLLVVVAVEGTSAHAQFNYPGGYGGWGWGGWGGGVGTVQGDVARGLGAFAEGAGIYNQQTAVANSINADTAMRWNQYVWEGQQEANRRYHDRLARQQQGIVQAREEVARRLRDNPEPRDIVRGDALNVAFDEVVNPRVYFRGLKATSVKVPGTLIRDIPFQYAVGAITVSVDQLTKGRPEALKAEAFAADRTNLKALAAELRKQNEEKGEFDPATLEKTQEAIRALRTKVEATLPRGTRQRTEAERYLKALFGLTRLLKTPAINVLLAGVEKRPEVTLAELLTFMTANNLRFGVASNPRQQEVNTTLFPLLAKARDEAAASLASSTEVKPVANGESRPADFFAGMPLEVLDRKPNTPVPPAPAPEPAPK